MPTYHLNNHPLNATSARVLELHADYACHNCGRCCREAWDIVLLAPDVERMERLLSQAGWSREAILDCFAPASPIQNQQRVKLAVSDCGACRFLEQAADRFLCRLHREHGLEVLPTVCQCYPRLAIGHPAGLYVTLTYSCPSAAQLLLKPDGLRESAPRRMLAGYQDLQGTVFYTADTTPQFSATCKPSWATFDYFWRWTPEWMSCKDLTPSQALYGLGSVIGYVEAQGPQAGDQMGLIDLLDEALRVLPRAIKRECDKLEPLTELGVIYMDTLVNLMSQLTSEGHRETTELWLALQQGDPATMRARIAREYDRLIRPHLAEFELIERNYIGSRLYANPLVYRANSLRTGYFVVVLLAVALRFTALSLCLRDGKALSEEVLIEAASLVDHLLQHNAVMQERFLKLLAESTTGDLHDLMRPAIF